MSKKANEQTSSTQYLTFTLRDEIFAVDISKIREVMDVATLTRIPRMPEYLNGVINLRGRVVPVMDLGLNLGLDTIEKTVNTAIIIVETEIEDSIVELGVMTDAVQNVMDLSPQDIEPAPRMGLTLKADFITGMGQLGDNFLIILDIDRVLTQDNKAYLHETMNSLQEMAARDTSKTSCNQAGT